MKCIMLVIVSIMFILSAQSHAGEYEYNKCTDSNGMIIKNQTEEIVLDYLKYQKYNTASEVDLILGIGLYLIPAPDVGIMEEKVIVVEKIEYDMLLNVAKTH